MPVISCGGMRYQFKWQDADPREIPADNQKNLEATIHRAFELGINHIETARGYGTSEMQLGSVLPQLPRDKIIVQTKVGPKATVREFLETFETSMKYLKLEHVDLFSLHGINNRESAGLVAEEKRLSRSGAQIAKGRARAVHRFFHARNARHHPRGGEHGRIRLLKRPLVFRE